MRDFEQSIGDINAEAVMQHAVSLFGVDRPEGVDVVIQRDSNYAIKKDEIGESTKYKVSYEHGDSGDELRAIAYPSDRRIARSRLTSFSVIVHSPKGDHVDFTDMRGDEVVEHQEGIQALDRIAQFLADAQKDLASVKP